MMEEQIRRRSSSAGRPSNQHLNHVPSANHFQDHNSHLDIDPAINSSAFTSGSFNPDGSSPNVNAHSQYNFPIPASIPGPPFKNQGLSNNNFDQRDLEQSYPQHDNTTNLQNPSSNLTLQQSSPQFPSELIGSNAPNGFEDLSQHDLAGKIGQDFSNPFLIETDLQGSIQPPHQSINPADIMSNMSSPQNLIPTPPNLMLPESHSPRQGSPAPSPGQMYSPNHSRHTSLDPSSAIFNQGQQQNDWTGMQFQIHRRAPSEHSDVSSSVAPSPYLQQHDGFDLDQNPSPMIGPQPDNPLYQDALGIGDFTLSDPQQQQQQQQQQRMSPRHSPFVSPRMHPQAGLGLMQENNFMLTDMNNNFNGGPGPEMFTTQNDAFPLFHQRHGSNDMGRATQMVPPEINVEFAPNTRQSTVEPSRQDNDYDALSPPDRGLSPDPSEGNILLTSFQAEGGVIELNQMAIFRALYLLALQVPVLVRLRTSCVNAPFPHLTLLFLRTCPVTRPPPPRLHAAPRLLPFQIAITSSNSQTRLVRPLQELTNGCRNTLQPFSARSALNASPAPTTCAHIFVRIRTNGLLSAPYVARHLLVNTIANATKAFILAKRNSSAKASLALVEAGDVVEDSRVRMLSDGISDPRPDESASSRCWTRRPWSANGYTTSRCSWIRA